MKQILTFFVFALFAISQMSCGDEEVEGYHGGVYSKNYIACYIDCDSALLKVFDNRIVVVFDGQVINSVHNPQKFDSLASANNDTKFDGLIIGLHESINDSISSISIKCDKDIDEGHLSGSELNDLFTFECKSYYSVLQEQHYDRYESEQMQMKAKDVTASKTRVIANDACSLTIDTSPAQSGTYTFNVSIQLSQKTLRNTVTMKF